VTFPDPVGCRQHLARRFGLDDESTRVPNGDLMNLRFTTLRLGALLVASISLADCAPAPAATSPASAAVGPTSSILTTDAEILAEMRSFADAIEPDAQPDAAKMQALVATATTTLDALSGAKPSGCLRGPLATYTSRLTSLRGAIARITAAGPTGSVADSDYTAILGGMLTMGQAVEDAQTACAAGSR
jgi:hypothetical protein